MSHAPTPWPEKIRYRPKRLTSYILREVTAALAPAVIAWLEKLPPVPEEYRDVPNPPPVERIPESRRDALFLRDGYKIASHLQLIHFIQPDSELVAILAPARDLLAAAFDRAWQQWLTDNDLGPLPIGTKVVFKHYLAKGPAEVIANDEAAGESTILFDDSGGNGCPQLTQSYRWEHLQIV